MKLLTFIKMMNSPLWTLFAFQTTDPVKVPKKDTSTFSGIPKLLRVKSPYRLSTDYTRDEMKKRYVPEGLRTYNEIDSSCNYFNTRATFDEKDVSYPYKIELDSYLDYRKQTLQKQCWDSLIARYDLSAALSGGDIARMISQATGLTIPVPPNPVMGIFGKPEININVNGEVNLRVGWRWDLTNQGTMSAYGQTQSSPVFSQDIRVNVSGRIGDKLKLGVDWNTRRQFELDNKFKIGYEGEDDEIIKLVEVGNVTLPLQSSLIGGGQALFGVRADFQFGPLFLKGIVSQRRGERRFIEVHGGASKQPFGIRAYDWAKNHFFLDMVYRDIYSKYFETATPVLPGDNLARENRVKELEVWESTNDPRDNSMSANGVAFTNLQPLPRGQFYPSSMKIKTQETGKVERGVYLRMDSTRYKIDYNLGTLTILNLRPDRYYAVSYRIENKTLDPGDDLYYGTFSTMVGMKDTLILKLVYCPNMLPAYDTLWKRQMKNIYSINASNVNTQDTKIGIYYISKRNDSSDVLPGAPDKLVTIFRIDQVTNSTGAPPPDGKFDLRPPFFDPALGEITFPSLEPFRQGLIDYFTLKQTPQIASQYIFPEVYDTTYDAARRNTARDRFIIGGEVSGRSTDRISLGAFNLAPNSVKVTLDGVPLREYEDYVVDYYSGQLTLRNPRASLPNANLRIEYEANDIFNISTRTLMGLRADYQLFKSRRMDAAIGATLMYYNQSAIIDRVRLGDEPVSNTMFGFDGRLTWDTPWLTKLLDYLPFYDTKANSSMNLRGEWAIMLPEPNKRRSEVASDNNEPVVYIDDFEGAQRVISLGSSPTLWYYASQPQDSSIAPDDKTAAMFRGKTFWYQYAIPRVPINDVYPQKQIVPGRTNLNPLQITFNPYQRGIYNANPDYRDPDNNGANFNDSSRKFIADNKPKLWGGLQRLFSSFNVNFNRENIEFIEIMMKIDEKDGDPAAAPKMYIDLGKISEDIIPNGMLNTEDGITAASPLPNGTLDSNEDVGIDEWDDLKEKTLYPWPLNLEEDPSRDNFLFDFQKDDNLRKEQDFVRYNNLEGNGKPGQGSELGQFPDQEIMNKNKGQTLSQANDYFSYEVNLDTDPKTNPQITGGNPDKGWLLYRIPVRKPTRRVGNPTLDNVEYVRIWFKGGLLKVSIAEWRLVGSHWERINNLQAGVKPDDEVLQVALVNVEENSGAPDYYTMPPGVQAPRQLNNPDPNLDIRLNEQSLSVSTRNLRYGDNRMAVRLFRPLDVFYYKKLKFFIHGDGSMPDNIVSGAVPKAYAFLRFGIDSLNYYEYRRPLLRDWQNIEIILAQLTAIKQRRDTSGENLFNRQEFPVGESDPYATFAIRGNPILTKVQFFGFGIENPAERYPNELTTTMWVDELRLLNPESSNDWAGIASADVKLADLGSINASMTHYRPNFHRLEERFGNRVSTTNWSVSTVGNLEKFAPKSFKEIKIPISYTHAEYMEDPEYGAFNDINLDEAVEAARIDAINKGYTPAEAERIANNVRISSQTLRVQDGWALTGLRLGLPTDFWLIRETFNKLTIGYSYSQEFERSPIVTERFNWEWRLNTQYAITIPELAAVKPLTWAKDIALLDSYTDWKFNFLPSNFQFATNFIRRRATEQSRFLPYPSPVIRNFSAQRQGQFSWKLSDNGLINPLIDYSFTTSSTLVPLELDENGRQRTGSELAGQMLFNNGKIIDFGENNIHGQTITINFKPKLPIGDYAKYLESSGSYSSAYAWNNPMQPDPRIADIAKSANYGANLRYNIGIKLKSFADYLFGTSDPKLSLQKPKFDTSAGSIWSIGKGLFKTIFLDFEKIDVTFNQTNSSINPGVFGGTGFDNFWARGVTFRGSEYQFGPSMAYQMGLVTNPHGGISIESSDSFPWFGFETSTGLRPPNAVMQDNFSQRSGFDIKTGRPLWQGAILDLTWRTDLGYNRNQTVLTDDRGNPTFTNVIANESFSRTYLTLPSVFGINIFNNTIEHVIDLFNQRKAEIDASNADTVTKNTEYLVALSESFRTGMEAFSITKGKTGKFLPAINWSIRWEGLEKWSILESVGTKRISLEHAYQSKYTENALINDNGRTIQAQQIQYGFQPLIGVTVAFDEKKLDGTLTATIRWSTTNAYQLNSSNRSTITKSAGDEIQVQGTYTLRGFEFSLLNLNIQNDIEFVLLFSYKKNKRATFDVLDYNGEQGRKLDGSSQFVLEPRVRYSMSQRLTLSLFYRYEGTVNEGASNPGFSTHMVALDIRLSIAGGR